jgi:hypothetical protein
MSRTSKLVEIIRFMVVYSQDKRRAKDGIMGKNGGISFK